MTDNIASAIKEYGNADQQAISEENQSINSYDDSVSQDSPISKIKPQASSNLTSDEPGEERSQSLLIPSDSYLSPTKINKYEL